MKYDKQYFQGLLEKIIAPIKQFYTPECAGLKLGNTGVHYGDHIAQMEGFSRILWGIAPIWAGGGDFDDFSEIYVKGLTAGTDPNSSEYWGEMNNCDQKFVEFAAIALALMISPEKVWVPLSEQAKKNLADYIFKINNYISPNNNWQMFAVMVNVALKKLGQKYSQDAIETGLAKIEGYYQDGGWYRDGINNPRDYYVAFAIHFYSLIYSKVCCDFDRERCELFRQRAVDFAKSFIYWFDEKGRGIAYGRSQTYRFAQGAFWSACLFADVPVFDYGVLKGIIARHLEEWLSNPIFDNTGILTIGYRYPNLIMSEQYNAHGSPYWSLKIFLFLALPDEHPFWHAEVLPLPKLEKQHFIKDARMIIQRNGESVTALPAGEGGLILHAHTFEKYCKFAYSSEFGFSVPRSSDFLDSAAPDSMLSFQIAKRGVFTRGFVDEAYVNENEIVSKWSPLPGINVRTTIIPTEKGHIRRHEIQSEYECIARDAGFALNMDADCQSECFESEICATVKNSFSYCTVKNTHGCGRPEVCCLAPNTSLVYQRTSMPMVTYEIPKGRICIETELEYL